MHKRPAEGFLAYEPHPSVQELRIGSIGRIAAGSEAGKYLLVEDNLAETAGYLILYGEDVKFTKGSDDWVLAEKLVGYFAECDYTIEWLDEEPVGQTSPVVPLPVID